MVDSQYEKKIQAFAKTSFRNYKKKERKLLTEQLIDDMHTFLESNPNITFDELAMHFSENSESAASGSTYPYRKWIGISILILMLAGGIIWYVSYTLSSDNRNIPIYTEDPAP